MATGERFADALVELVEDFFRVDQTAKAVVASYQDAAFYPKYGFDNQGDDVSKAMEKTPNLRLTAIFTDVNAPWVDEFAFTLRDYFAEKGEFAKHLDVTKQHFRRTEWTE